MKYIVIGFRYCVLIFLIGGISSACVPMKSESNSDYANVIEEGANALEQGDYKTAHDLIFPFAESGVAEAQYTIALIYGWGYSPNNTNPSISEREDLSLIWIKKAATQGFPQATELLANSYKNGWYGLEKSDRLSQCWEAAADNVDIAKSCMNKQK